MRIFDNPNILLREVVCERLLNLDSMSGMVVIYNVPIVSSSNIVMGTAHYVGIESSLPDSSIVSMLSTPQTAQELNDLSDYQSARASFNQLPNWATWTAQQASDYILNNVLNGMTQAQVDSYINANTVDTVLHQIGATLINIRTILQNIAMAIIYLRNLIVRFR